MKNDLLDVLETGTEEEKEVLRLALQAIRQKRERGSAYPSGFLGLSGAFIGEREYRFRIPITSYMLNRGGIVHGGITATLADSTMGSLINKSLPKSQFAVTVEMKTHFLQPGRGKELISTARLIRLGQTLAVADCQVENERGTLIALTTGTFSIQTWPVHASSR
ncbi:PaaI family thioesterase [Salinithrix halophila]|uniref:PaaI family thioesterase n=1 Tax=Salinithrix halophila TaxID=1485204 RepID=A0ABV8JI11_9BACL